MTIQNIIREYELRKRYENFWRYIPYQISALGDRK